MSTALRCPPAPLRVRLRLARPDDAPALEALQHRAARAITARAWGAPAVEAWIRDMGTLDRALIEDGTYFVATVDGALAGCGGWSFRRRGHGAGPASDERPLDPATEPAWIRAMFVEPRLARRGVGAAVLAGAERAAAAAGYWRVALDATPSGEPLYRGAGYRAIETLEALLPGGLRLPLLRMEKPLWAAIGARQPALGNRV